MAYRDPSEALRARISTQKEAAMARRSRITDALLQQLPGALAPRLLAAEKKLPKRRANKLATLRRQLAAVEAYAAAVDEVYALVPRLDQHLQHIKTGFPKRTKPQHYGYPDIYHRRIELLRKKTHRKLLSFDGKAKLFDTKTNYFNEQEFPLLIDAQLRAAGVPLTIAVYTVILSDNNSNKSYSDTRHFGFDVRCFIARGAPAVQVHPQGSADRLMQWVGIQKDVDTGDALFDNAFRVLRPGAPGVTHILDSRVRRALRSLHETTKPHPSLNLPRLVIAGGEAQVSWLDEHPRAHAIDIAIGVLKHLRAMQPPALLTLPNNS